MTNSTIEGNTAFYYEGGGIFNFYGTLTVTNSTVYDNSAGTFGGGIYSANNALTVKNSTISGNSAAGSGGGGIIHNLGLMNLTNTIIANSPSGGDCILHSGVLQGSNNLVENGATCLPTLTGDPLLGPLANNGGPTQTHALLAGSPAIDADDAAACPDTDQRGVARPQGDGCDIGAYEYVPLRYVYLPLVVR